MSATAPTTTTRPAPEGFAPKVLWMFTTLALARVLDVGTGVLTARLLGPHDRGLYSLLLTIPHTLESLLRLGVAPANIYMMCRHRVEGAFIVGNSVLLALGLGALALLALPFRDFVGDRLLAGVGGWYLTLAVLLVPFYLLSTYMTSVLHAVDRFQVVNRRTILAAALRLLGTALVLIVLQQGLFEAFLVHVVLGVLAGVWLLPVVWRVTASVRPHLGVALATVRFGLKSHVQTLVTTLHLRLDLFLVALLLGPADVAFYALATHIAELIGGIHRPVSIVLYPRLASSTEARMHDTTITVCRHVLLLETLACGAVAVGAKFAIGLLYGAEYLPAVPPLLILLPGILMMSLYNLLGRNFTSRNRQQTTIMAGALALVVNVVLNLVLIPRLGLNGAALASTVSYSLATIVLLVAFRRHSRAPLTGLVRVQRGDLDVYTRLLARLAVRPAAA
jgi:O-antigen/teichoic acid export membrane protein